MNVFELSSIVGLLAPALGVGTFGLLWRPSLQHFWWFIGLGGISLYLLMGVFVTYAFSNTGLSGNRSDPADGAIDAVMHNYFLHMLAWAFCSVLVLRVIRYFLSKI